MVPFWVLSIIRHLVSREPLKGTVVLTTTHILGAMGHSRSPLKVALIYRALGPGIARRHGARIWTSGLGTSLWIHRESPESHTSIKPYIYIYICMYIHICVEIYVDIHLDVEVNMKF